MNNSFILILSFTSLIAFGQTSPPSNSTAPQQNIPAPPVPTHPGTEPNNRVMLRSQTDSMDSRRKPVPVNKPLNGDTMGHKRTFKSNGDPIVNPARIDSVH
ncbi:hypothetical protein BH11BAC1_BH11BAC1_27430 [soil metagenome]